MLWFPAVQEVTDVRLSMVLTRNMYVLWDRTRYFEDWRIHRPCDCSLYCFLPVQNVSGPRGRGTGQTVSQMTSWQNGCNSRSCSPIPVSLCQGRVEGGGGWGQNLKQPPGEQEDVVTNVWLTWVLSIFIYARHWNKHLDCIHVNTHT